ncbi:hypothetical protein DFH06DRAFT_975917, partial [Mycena polygramma]
HHRMPYLRELLRRDGLGEASDVVCPGCTSGVPAYRCRDCKGNLLFCKECCLMRHAANPLHIIDCWNGVFFVKSTLRDLGLRVQMGHPPNEACGKPEPAREGFVIIHDGGIHYVDVDYCACERRRAAGAHHIQLLRAGWYPASPKRPQTCMTLTSLERFHMEALQAKTTMYDFY